MSRESTAQFLRHFVRAYPARTAAMVLLLLLSSLAEGVSLMALLPLLELSTGEALSEPGEWVLAGVEALGLPPTLPVLLGGITALMTAKGVCRWLAMRHAGYTVVQVTSDLRLGLLRALLAARWSHLSGRSTGRLVHAISSEAERASLAYREMCNGLAAALQIAIYFAAAAFLSWQAAVAAVALGAGVVWLLRSFTRMSREAGHRQTAVTSALIAQATEVIPGLKPIKAMGREQTFLRWLETRVHESDAALRRTIQARDIPSSFREPAFVLILAVAFVLAVEVAGLPFPVVTLLAVMLYRVMMAAGDLQGQYQIAVHGESAFWALHRRIEAARYAREAPGGEGGERPIPHLRRGIEVRDVHVQYGQTEVLREASLVIPAGALVTLVGPSGAGKTTLLDVLAALVAPTAGAVLIDGTPLTELDTTAWRTRIGYVPQTPLLFHDTVYNNVTAGDEGLGRAEVEEALRLAGAWPIVAALPDGLDHVVGERGGRLSGGQGQRIALARALAHRPQLLILDEVTSALDPALVDDVCATLRALRGRATLVAVSHQPALRDAADLVYRVDRGAVLLECDRRVEAAEGSGDGAALEEATA